LGADVPMLELMADYGCYPLWLRSGGELRNVDPATLDISPELRDALTGWAEEYDATLDTSDPVASGFVDGDAENAFYERGDRLARWLAGEVGARFRVSYFDARTGGARLVE